MTSRFSTLLAGATGLAVLSALAVATPAAALTSAECSALYKAAQQAKTLNGLNWNDFQKTKCAEAAPAAATTTAAPAAKEEPKVAQAATKAETKPAAAATTTPAPAAAAATKGLTSKECSLKYKEAKAANTLNGQKWKDFQKAQCGPGSAPPVGKVDNATAAAAAAASNAVFPTAVAAKYASEKPGKARMHTCLDQYKANKATNGNGGLKWIQRTGGGYYSECNKRLKKQ